MTLPLERLGCKFLGELFFSVLVCKSDCSKVLLTDTFASLRFPCATDPLQSYEQY